MIMIHAIFTNNNEILFDFFTRTSRTKFNSFQLQKKKNPYSQPLPLTHVKNGHKIMWRIEIYNNQWELRNMQLEGLVFYAFGWRVVRCGVFVFPFPWE
jgi:hypothetical protein